MLTLITYRLTRGMRTERRALKLGLDANVVSISVSFWSHYSYDLFEHSLKVNRYYLS